MQTTIWWSILIQGSLGGFRLFLDTCAIGKVLTAAFRQAFRLCNMSLESSLEVLHPAMGFRGNRADLRIID